MKLRSRSSAEKRRPSMFWVLASLILPLWSLMVRYRFTRESRLPQTGPFILAPNHYSEIDPVAMGAAVWHLGRLPRFMAKASLFKVPVLGWLLRSSGQIPVERAGASRGGNNPMGDAGGLIQREAGVIVYPEGTLTRDPELWPMRGKSGAVRLALETGIPLIPVAHWGTQELMPRYAKRIHPFPRKTIRVSVGEPLDLSRFRTGPIDQRVVTEATEVLMQAITALLAELRGEQAPPERWDPSKHQQSETGRF
ncbi:1-acyl-sn-glycerol-3-phosphate acyltransferase [Leucobacter sp. OLJS4]|nr:1-acyl-sn-glycerol-3-phosphate acyltransferase [Leucobacter sp. OLCALW19]PII88163.1 1-acyl-sn-glycerol-3-phosphate acyltransferase [Leucobacter sp. OLTLW20]PII92045.1 1-acyl-sn-glycerol-3-phosphate acyltransferase [Leucobacter sp. OLAS13]PII99016.1 1-acyl-sn-glycerol-3-phosphate acyltransferase [Leucobacter sp. OLCS4]PIJ00357.1 1-acyl-sn-glycerol-3-phosphate acyltransferase [Leucobacter sp. OLDS2]PIJ04569.1 1-acyl-sn-glycerol-3-phosphate acyltransferase [Leucobacter sp. OLIS6]PIJ12923.1 1-